MCKIWGSLGRSTPRAKSPAPLPRAELKPSQIQHMLGNVFLFSVPEK